MFAQKETPRTRLRRQLTSIRNRRFEPTLGFDPAAPTVILSPHVDDAVIDCWSVLTSEGDVRVVNIFTGAPAPGWVGWPDQITGATDSAARMAERVIEDAEALGLAGREPINLDLPEWQYRPQGAEPTFAELDAAIARSVPTISRVLAPASLGAHHPDHRLMRSFALALRARGCAVALYADVPYGVEYGWPSWVTGNEPNRYIDVDCFWRPTFEGVPGMPALREAEIERLDSVQAEAKLAAMKAYRTQFPGLDGGASGLLSNPAVHGYEVRWQLSPAKASDGA